MGSQHWKECCRKRAFVCISIYLSNDALKTICLF
jgi:hypothetical protein